MVQIAQEDDWTTPAPGTNEQRAQFLAQLNGLIDDLERVRNAAIALRDNPGDDTGHYYVQGVTLAGAARQDALFRGEQMAAAVFPSPARVSIPRLAKALRLSVNTLRSHIVNPPRVDADADTPTF